MHVAKYWRNKKLRYRLIRISQNMAGRESEPRGEKRDEATPTAAHKIRQAEYAT